MSVRGRGTLPAAETVGRPIDVRTEVAVVPRPRAWCDHEDEW